MNRGSVDSFLEEGCGRCDRYRTADCKVHLWTDVLIELRALVRNTDLDEEMKWGSPCYTWKGKNVVMITALKDYCALSFFKGALLADPDSLLEAPGPNSQAARLLKFTSADEVRASRERTKKLIDQAIAAEVAGKKVKFRSSPEPVPEELQALLDADPTLRSAFEELTPGRQRSHILYVTGAKQSKTREKRAQKCAGKIREGKGFLDR